MGTLNRKLGKQLHDPAGTGPIASTGHARTAQGGDGRTRDLKGELFLLATTHLFGQGAFAETAELRDGRFAELVRQATWADPDWTARLLWWLRGEGNLRTVAVAGAAISAHARLAGPTWQALPVSSVTFGAQQLQVTAATLKALPTTPTISVRQLVADVLQRPDEPGEFIAMWRLLTGQTDRTRAARLPGGVQRGVADAVNRLFTERAALRYDGTGQAFRLGDVLQIVHPKPTQTWQRELHQYLLDRRYPTAAGRADLAQLPTIAARLDLEDVPQDERRALLSRPEAATILRAAGMSWETLATWLGGPMDAAAWQAIAPSMGYMALLRNLRNMEQTGVDQTTVDMVCAKLADPGQVARARQLPMRFLSAIKATGSVQWWPALERALQESLRNVPQLQGDTLILLDLSDSMLAPMSDRSELTRWEAAAVFAAALAARNPTARLVRYGWYSEDVTPSRGASILPVVKALAQVPDSLQTTNTRDPYGRSFHRAQLMGGTETATAIRQHLRRTDRRVVLLTDEQHHGEAPTGAVRPHTWLHTFNVAGEQVGGLSGVPFRHTVGGLTDAGFAQISRVEAGTDGVWPWQLAAALAI